MIQTICDMFSISNGDYTGKLEKVHWDVSPSQQRKVGSHQFFLSYQVKKAVAEVTKMGFYLSRILLNLTLT